MKKTMKISLLILTLSALSACSVKTSKSTSTNSTSTSGTNTSTTGGGTTTTGGGTTTTGGVSCDGVYHDGATRCYYKNIPTIQVMGATSSAIANGTPFWTTQSLGSSISPGQFNSDAMLNLRIVPRIAVKTSPAVNPSVSGKTCNHTMTADKIASKLMIQVKVQTYNDYAAGSGNGQVATLDAAIDQASKVWHFDMSSLPNDASHPLVFKVVSVLTDSRCRQGGTGYCPYSDLPLSSPTYTYPTECVAFDIQFATDETYDLPGTSAN